MAKPALKLVPETPDRPAPRLALSFVPELDGVRGLACLLVVLYHSEGIFLAAAESRFASWMKVFDWGASGVDLFFVLSAYLLTRILLRTKASSTYYRSFYGRRMLRIFPLYYLTLGAVFTGYVVLGWGGDRVGLWEPHRYSMWFFFSNVSMALHGPAPFGTLHFWSLAVEEQFYVFWPLVVAFLSEGRLFKLCVGLMFFSLALRLGLNDLYHVDSMVNRFLLPTRLDCFAIGAIIALLAEARQDEIIGRLRAVLGISGLAFIGAAYLAGQEYSINTPSFITYGLTGNVLLGGAILAHAHYCGTSGKRDRFLSSKVMTRIGAYSYGIYVLHFPLLRAMGKVSVGLPQDSLLSFTLKFALYIGGSCVAGFLSWYFFEKHFLRLKKYFP